jgi:arabinofuranosyltransferase
MNGSNIRLGVLTASAVFFVATSAMFFPFTVDDAYIVARYAHNLRSVGEWAFNPGEHISAMTSPLHGILLVVFSFFGAEPLSIYKAFALVLVAAGSTLLLVHYGIHRREAIVLASVLVAPSFILWTIAGLETPLLAAIATAMAWILSFGKSEDDRPLLALGLLAGLAVLARYDAVLFAGPVLLTGLLRRGRSRRARLIAAVLAAAPPMLWFLYAWRQFGEILPTSFYLKTPSSALDVFAVNSRYMSEHLVILGLAAMVAYAAARVAASGAARDVLVAEVRARWGLHLGIIAMLVYGGSMATVHMMFAFRHYMPYLAATALALALFVRRADDRMSDAKRRSPVWIEVVAALTILTVHVFQAEALHHRSLQGLGRGGEYGAQGAAGYARDFIPAMRRNAEDVRAHWESLKMDRPPRIWTFAAGALPYAYREAYIFEGLVSFRHHCPASEPGRVPDWRVWRAHADYIHVFTRHAAINRSLAPVRLRQVQLISEQRLNFNGREERVLVYYNASPRPNLLPPTIHEPCLTFSHHGS